MGRGEATGVDAEVFESAGDEGGDGTFSICASDVDGVEGLGEALDESFDAGEAELDHVMMRCLVPTLIAVSGKVDFNSKPDCGSQMGGTGRSLAWRYG
jgi:hypothetical protein